MAQGKYSFQDFRTAVEAAIDSTADTVFLVSSLWGFAHRLDSPPRESGRWVLDAVDEAVGPERTFILPAFTYSFGKTRVFDVVRSKPETGSVPEAAHITGRMIRSWRPMTSYLVRGPRAREFISEPSMSSFGKHGPLGWICEREACILGLGLADPRFMGWVVCHHGEALCDVPYRYDKRIAGKLYEDGRNETDCHEDVYVRSITGEPKQNWLALNSELAGRGLLYRHSDNALSLQSANAKHVRDVCVEILSRDPYCCFDDPEPVKAWVHREKQREINALKPDERLVELSRPT